MLYLPDVNILIYAKMSGMPEHKAAHSWLDKTLKDPNSSILLSETTLLFFLRITTNVKIFDPPLSFAEADSFTSDLLEWKNTLIFQPSIGHFSEVAQFMKKYDFAGNLAMDAHLAVMALNTGSTLVTRDSDFDQIPYLKLINPIGSISDE